MWEVCPQPFAEQVAHLKRQAQQHITRLLDAGGHGRLQDALDFHVVERRDHRRHHHRRRHADLRQPAQRLQPPHRRRRARLHLAREFGVERSDRERDLGELALCHAGENVEIAQHQRRLGDNADRMVGAVEHFQDAAHDFVAPLDRLIGIGIGADGDHLRRIAGRRQFLRQKLGGFRLHEQLGFEIESGRQAEIGVGRAREAVDAAVLAAAIGIDRAVETDVGRVVAGDDLAGGIRRHRSLERRQFVERTPAVVEGDARQRLVATHGIALGAAPAPALVFDHDAEQFGRVVDIDARQRGGQLLFRRASQV